jgi:hypothetical protein
MSTNKQNDDGAAEYREAQLPKESDDALLSKIRTVVEDSATTKLRQHYRWTQGYTIHSGSKTAETELCSNTRQP